jgi:excisionase family DNA binding protein
MDNQPQGLGQVLERLDKVDATLAELVRQRTVKNWYTTEEVAKILGRSEYTLREWCRHGRIAADKRGSRSGNAQSARGALTLADVNSQTIPLSNSMFLIRRSDVK